MTMVWPTLVILILAFDNLVEATVDVGITTGTDDYYGIRLGYIVRSRSIRRGHPLSFLSSSIRGTLYCVDESTIFVRKFVLEELDDNKFVKFYAVRLHRNSTWDENVRFDKEALLDIVTGSNTPLRSEGYAGENFLLKFPEGDKINQFDGIVVLYDALSLRIPLSDLINVPRDLLPPRPSVLREFRADGEILIHRVHADPVVALNRRQIALHNFNYDGFSPPTTTFWVGRGNRVNRDGTRVVGPDSDRQGWVPRYTDANITITLPDNLTVFDIDYLSLYNILFALDLGHVFFNLTGTNLPPYFDNDTFVPVIPIIPVHPINLINTFTFGVDYGVRAASVIALNTKQIFLKDFSYNGGCSEAFFWVGLDANGFEDGPPYVDVVEGMYYRVQRLKSSSGDSNTPLLPHHKTNVTVTLQGKFTLYDFDFFALFCDSFAEPKHIAIAFLPVKERRKYDGRLPDYIGDEDGNGEEEEQEEESEEEDPEKEEPEEEEPEEESEEEEPEEEAEEDKEEENSERTRVSYYLRKIWLNIFTCFVIFC